MKIFEKRMRILWPTFVIGTLLACLLLMSLIEGQTRLLSRTGTSRMIFKEEDPRGFFHVVSIYATCAFGTYFFAFFRFRKGSWMNPR